MTDGFCEFWRSYHRDRNFTEGKPSRARGYDVVRDIAVLVDHHKGGVQRFSEFPGQADQSEPSDASSGREVGRGVVELQAHFAFSRGSLLATHAEVRIAL